MSADRAAPAFTALRYEVADAVATVTLDRPDALNALTVPLKTELLAAFRAIARDRTIRAVVLTGAGRAFCAGQDLKERLEPDAAPLAVELRERYNPIIAAMRGLDQPIVGAINGVAAGAGASLAFACDIRLAAESASFILAFGRIGLVPDSGATWFLPRLVGLGQGRRDGPDRCAVVGGRGGTGRAGLAGRPGRHARGRGAVRRDAPGRAGARRAGPDEACAPADAGRSISRPRSRTRPIARGSPAPRPITPRGSPPSSRSGRLGSPGSSPRRGYGIVMSLTSDSATSRFPASVSNRTCRRTWYVPGSIVSTSVVEVAGVSPTQTAVAPSR